MNIPNNSVTFQVLWNRLLAIVEEQAQVLIRTAFSPMVRYCGDVSVAAFDVRGRMLAQAVTGTPGHVNTMAEAVGHFLDRFPLDEMREGDAYITNDPWLGTGHLNDFTVLTPAFHEGRCVALFACTSHIMDVGGLGASTEALDVLSEGIYVPHLKLLDGGVINDTLMAMLEANSRLPVDIVGDIFSLAACNDAGVKRLGETFREFGLTGIDDVSQHIIETSRAAVLKRVSELPKGCWRNELMLDGYDSPIRLYASLTISDAGIHIDFDGTDPVVAKGINVPLTYTKAYACFGVACSVFGDIPNNSGSLSSLTVSAPEGSIVNAQKPAPVGARHVVGQMIPDLILGCLAQALPDRIPAEGASCMWNISLRGTARSGRNYTLAGWAHDPGLTGFRRRPFRRGYLACPWRSSKARCLSCSGGRNCSPIAGALDARAVASVRSLSSRMSKAAPSGSAPHMSASIIPHVADLAALMERLAMSNWPREKSFRERGCRRYQRVPGSSCIRLAGRDLAQPRSDLLSGSKPI